MKRSCWFIFAIVMLVSSAAIADRPIFLVTPSGVYQSVVDSSGKPGAWTPIAADVIVQGFSTGGPNPPAPPSPPSSDPLVLQITILSKNVLDDKNDATAIAAIIDSIAKLKLSEADFRQSLEMAAPIMDVSLGTGDRLAGWTKKALLITADPVKLKAGLADSWGVEQATLETIHAACVNPTPETTEKAINWNLLISVIQTILTLLKNLGIQGG